jgi:hypothetical protein
MVGSFARLRKRTVRPLLKVLLEELRAVEYGRVPECCACFFGEKQHGRGQCLQYEYIAGVNHGTETCEIHTIAMWCDRDYTVAGQLYDVIELLIEAAQS